MVVNKTYLHELNLAFTNTRRTVSENKTTVERVPFYAGDLSVIKSEQITMLNNETKTPDNQGHSSTDQIKFRKKKG